MSAPAEVPTTISFFYNNVFSWTRHAIDSLGAASIEARGDNRLYSSPIDTVSRTLSRTNWLPEPIDCPNQSIAPTNRLPQPIDYPNQSIARTNRLPQLIDCPNQSIAPTNREPEPIGCPNQSVARQRDFQSNTVEGQ